MATEKKSLVEEALLQMKNLENVVTENAKGILASTMKGEIEELVKESLEEGADGMTEDETNPEMKEGVYKNMEEQDGEEDSLEIDMSDDGMSDDNMELSMDDMSMGDEMDDDDMMDDEDMMGDDDEELSPLDMTQASDDELLKIVMGMGDEDRLIIQKDGDNADVDMLTQTDSMSFPMGDDEFDMGDDDSMDFEDDEEEIVYEIEMEEDENPSDDGGVNESMTVKPKGVGMGSGPKKVGFKGENIHKGPKGKSAPEAKKFVKGEFKEGEYGMNKGDESKTHKGDEDYTTKKGNTLTRKAFEKNEEDEVKEASRTYGNGSRNTPGRGLPKMKVITNSALKEEVETLRAKNDEYRKALNIFREKLNEVAVFNSNLAYATRLFTEHSTTKQEKINIMRRFDNVETIKESKNLYTQIKSELDTKETSVVKESIVESIDRTPTKGSSNLVENKTYENPQFLRMKDLMSKLNK
jgi:hypothetical protein